MCVLYSVRLLVGYLVSFTFYALVVFVRGSILVLLSLRDDSAYIERLVYTSVD